MSILIKNIIHDKEETNVYIEGNLIADIGTSSPEADYKIDGKNKAIIPGFINTHTHASMTLLRGYADDMELHEWLEKKIWPVEANLEADDIYWGTKLACLEMIKSGTTCFNDMYYQGQVAVKAVEEMGIRAAISEVYFDLFNPDLGEKNAKTTLEGIQKLKEIKCERIMPAVGPHAIYTVSGERLSWLKELADKEDLLIHFHLCETKKEIEDFREKNGKKPVPYLEEIGFLDEKLIAVHCVWLDKEDIAILAKHNVKISHNPISNMKLAVGGTLPYNEMKKANLVVSLGTDGAASNNNLDMFDSMKFAAIAQKYNTSDPTIMPANEIFNIATKNGAMALRLNAGEVLEGKLADVILIDLKRADLSPNHDLISSLVYSSNGSCVDTVICDGKILMQGREVQGEEEILEEAQKIAFNLVKRT
jgi:5-methylthioadenosine/S-adenosylhomocysteine deaminase